MDGDGLDDFVVSASLQGVEFAEEGGRVYLLLGTNVDPDLVGELADADAVLVGSYAGGQFGYDTGPAGDVDGDGLDDLAIGANQAGQGGFLTGEAYIFLGSTMAGGELSDVDADLRFTSFQEKHLLGSSIEGDMDLDGDGRPELVLGAPGLAPPTLWKPEADPVVPEGMDSPGDVYLYWGTDLQPGVHDVTQASVHLTGTQLNEHAGIRVTSPGDVDGDGHDDLFIGTERGGLDPDAPGQMGVGQAYLLIGLHP